MSDPDKNLDFDEDLGAPTDPEPAPEPAARSISSKTPAAKPSSIASKTPAKKGYGGGEDATLYFESTIGPGSKKQKLLVNTGNDVSAIKTTVGNMFGLNPEDFHLTHGGVTLDEGTKLKDASNIRDGDTILLIPASTAGI